MSDDYVVTSAGGWCAPQIELPEVAVKRGGIRYEQSVARGEARTLRLQRLRRHVIAPLAALVYLGSVVLANYLTTHYGFIDVGYGQMATAGTLAAGGALVVRDVLQDAIGRLGVLALIAAAALLSYLAANPLVATASAAAFATSEVLDMAVYTPLRKRGTFGGPWWHRGVVAGAALGAVADTVVFLWIAFGWATVGPGLPGQLLAKGEVVLVLLALGGMSGAVLRQPLDQRRP